jgi:peptidoglycan/LPS O-acetylase OafA/YrhL
MNRLDPLTGLRGVAAYSVLIAHGIDTSFLYAGVSVFHPFGARVAYFGMSLFFVLSGFVIQYNYAAMFTSNNLGRATYRFFVARVARLYPLYAVTILLNIAYIPSPYFSGNSPALAAYLTLTQSWFNMQMATFPPDWSISTEWFFYFAFLALVPIIARIRRPLVALVVFCAAAAAGLMIGLHFARQPLLDFVQRWAWHGERVSASPELWLTYFCPYVRAFEFVAGMLAAKAYLALPPRSRAPVAASVASGAALLWCVAVVVFGRLARAPFLADLISNFIFAPALAAIMICSCRYDNYLGRVLRLRPMLFAGEISYSVYIWSWIMFDALANRFSSSLPTPLAYFNSVVKLLLTIAVTTVVAYGSYLLIETPARRWLRAALIRPVAAPHAASLRPPIS